MIHYLSLTHLEQMTGETELLVSQLHGTMPFYTLDQRSFRVLIQLNMWTHVIEQPNCLKGNTAEKLKFIFAWPHSLARIWLL